MDSRTEHRPIATAEGPERLGIQNAALLEALKEGGKDGIHTGWHVFDCPGAERGHACWHRCIRARAAIEEAEKGKK